MGKFNWLVLAAVLLTPVAVICFSILLKLGIESSLERYGMWTTAFMVLSLTPLLVVLGFLFDRRQDRKSDSREGSPPSWQ